MSHRAYVFNGDADGLCALQQLYLSDPRDAKLLSGVKREHELLQKLDASDVECVTVLDLALSKNLDALANLLKAGKRIDYFDHHFAGDIPFHPNLRVLIDTDPQVCTSVIVDRWLNGGAHRWSIVGAFGDNLIETATRLAQTAGLDEREQAQYAELGKLLNYNSYGRTLADLHFSPIDLHQQMREYADPLDFIACEKRVDELREAFALDYSFANSVIAENRPGGRVYFLPDLPWARRLGGVFANIVSNADSDNATAVVAEIEAGDYQIHIRTPRQGFAAAGEFCGRFSGGGGRACAGGINRLPRTDLEHFLQEFDRTYYCT